MKITKVRKCKECGVVLSTDKNNIGYTPDLNFKYCQRCFKLKNYQSNSFSKQSADIAQKNIDDLVLKSNDVVFLINDILNINADLIKQYQHQPNIIYVFNKIDLIVNHNNYSIILNNLVKYLASLQIKNPKIILTSVKTHYGIKVLNETIQAFPLRNKKYLIGDTNSGKSSLINQLLQLNKLNNKDVVVSNYLNTTLTYKKIRINKHIIIDSPGSSYNKSILNNIDSSKNISKLFNLKKAKSMYFLVKHQQAFMIDKLCNIIITPKLVNCGVSFFLELNLDIIRSSVEKLSANTKNIKSKLNVLNNKKITFKFDNLNELITFQISGLGHIIVKNASMVDIETFDNVKIDMIKGRIC